MLNAENLSVHCDWEGAKETQRLDEAEITFERIWADEEPGLRVLELPEAVKKRLIESWPYSFLLCDEVGLGKTIEAGLHSVL